MMIHQVGEEIFSLACRGMNEKILDTDDQNEMPIKRRIVPAEQTELSSLANLTSVFDLAHCPLNLRALFSYGERYPHYRIERGEGWTRFRQVEERERKHGSSARKTDAPGRSCPDHPRPLRRLGRYMPEASRQKMGMQHDRGSNRRNARHGW